MRKAFTLPALVAILASAILLAACPVTSSAAARSSLAPFEHQALVWHGCQASPSDRVGAALDAAGAECTRMTVPLDYSRPAGRTISIAVSRLPATDPARRRGVLLINPGGPGAPGLPQVLLAGSMPKIAARYDLIGMDPRFVGRGDPLHCDWHTDTFVRSAGPDAATFGRSVRTARRLAAGCARGQRRLLRFASTRNTARDMDVLRAALGEPKISYLGVSYGTYLGATYMQMFGAHADRLVLDSAVDPNTYGPGLLRHTAGPAEAALAHWAAWAAEHHARYGLGRSVPAVLGLVHRLDRLAAQKPLRAGPYRIGPHVYPYLLFSGLGDDSAASYGALAGEVAYLARSANGSKARPNAQFEAVLAGIYRGTGEATDRAGTPILCADRAASREPATYLRAIERRRKADPLFAPLAWNITPCAFWRSRPLEPPTRIGNATPALMVGAADDPVTPHAGQLQMHRDLTGSRLVTLADAFRHGVFLAAGSRCIDDAVTRYLVAGRLPARDATCPAVPSG